MYNRKKLFRERLEIYLMQLTVAYRPTLLWFGLFCTAFSLAMVANHITAGYGTALISLLPLALAGSFRFVVLAARFIAWAVTLVKRAF